MRRSLSIWLAVWLLLAGGLSAAEPARVQATQPPAAAQTAPLLAGCEYNYPPFCIVEDNDVAAGFSVELLRSTLHAVGRSVVYKVGAWSELKQDLAEGRLQVLPLVGRTPEREKQYDFTFPYLTMHGAIVVRSETKEVRSLADLRGRRVVVMKGDNAEEFMRRTDTGAVLSTTATSEEALRELADGQQDAAVMQRLLALRLIRELGIGNLELAGGIIPEFKQEFCFAVRDGDRERLALLNEGLALVMADGTFRQLHAQWFSELEAGAGGKSRVIVGGDQDYPPYEYLDENGQPNGYNVDLTRAIARRVGLNVEFRLGPWNQIREELTQGKIDICQGVFYSPERDRRLSFSPPHTMIQHVIVTRSDRVDPPKNMLDLAGLKLVVMRGDIMHDLVLARGYGPNTAVAPSQEQALTELAAGRHDCALVAKIPALYWISRHGWKNLWVGEESVSTPEYCYAVAHGGDELLARFVEGLNTLKDSGEYRRIKTKWLGVYEADDPRMRLWLRYLAWASGGLLVLFVAGAVWFHSLRREVGRRTAELQRSHATLQAALDQSEAGIAIADAPSGRLLYVNDAGLLIRGGDRAKLQDNITSDEYVVTWRIFDFNGRPLTSEDVPLTRAIRYGENSSREFLIRRDNGEERAVWAKAAPIRDAAGQIVAGIVIFMDITDRRRVDREREAATEILRLINKYSQTRELIQEFTRYLQEWSGCEAVGVRLKAGDDYPYYETRGFPADFVKLENHLCEHDEKGQCVRDEQGRPALDCMCGNILRGRFDPAKSFFTMNGSFWSNCTTELLATTTEADRQARTRNRCNGEGYESVALVALRYGGETLGLLQLNDHHPNRFTPQFIRLLERMADNLAVALAQRQAETALRESEERFRDFFFHMTAGMAIYEAVDEGADFTFADLNPAGERISRVRIAELRGRRLTEVFPGVEEMGLLAVLRRVWLTGQAEYLPMSRYQDERVTLWVENRVFRLPSGQVAALYDDRTEQKQSEERLHQADKMQAIGQLAGGIAHDFNNQLAAILGYAEILAQNLTDERLRRQVRLIHAAAERSADLTKQLLAFGRKGKYLSVPVDLHATIAEVAGLLGHSLDKRIRIEQDLRAQTPAVLGDPTQLQNALLNLALNARDAMPRGGTLTFATAEVRLDEDFCAARIQEIAPGAYLRITVSDTGVGMSPEVKQHIFEPFFTTKKEGQGTGLGLASVYGAIRNHRGLVEVESEVGRGAAVVILLPRLESAPASPAGPAAAAKVSVPPQAGRSLRVLVVDDEAIIGEMLSDMLRELGHQAVVCSGGRQAIDRYRDESAQIDLAILDMVMPDLGGQELFCALLQINPQLRVIFSSGYSVDGAPQAGLDAGGRVFMSKPFKFENLSAAIAAALAEG